MLGSYARRAFTTKTPPLTQRSVRRRWFRRLLASAAVIAVTAALWQRWRLRREHGHEPIAQSPQPVPVGGFVGVAETGADRWKHAARAIVAHTDDARFDAHNTALRASLSAFLSAAALDPSLSRGSSVWLLCAVALDPQLAASVRQLALRVLDRLASNPQTADRIVAIGGDDLITYAARFDGVTDKLFAARVRLTDRAHTYPTPFEHSIDTASASLDPLLSSLSRLPRLSEYLHVYLEREEGGVARAGDEGRMKSLHPAIAEEDLQLLQLSSETTASHQQQHAFTAAFMRVSSLVQSVRSYTGLPRADRPSSSATCQTRFQQLRLLASLCDQGAVCDHLLRHGLMPRLAVFMAAQSRDEVRLQVQCARLLANAAQHDNDAAEQLECNYLIDTVVQWARAPPRAEAEGETEVEQLDGENRADQHTSQRPSQPLPMAATPVHHWLTAITGTLLQPLVDALTPYIQAVSPSTSPAAPPPTLPAPPPPMRPVSSPPSDSVSALRQVRHSQSVRALANLAAQREKKRRHRAVRDHPHARHRLPATLIPVYGDEVYLLHPPLEPITNDVETNVGLPLDIVFVHGLLGHPLRTWRLHTTTDEPDSGSVWGDDYDWTEINGSDDAIDEIARWMQPRKIKEFRAKQHQHTRTQQTPKSATIDQSHAHPHAPRVRGSELIWPRDWLPTDLPFPVRVLSIGFRSSLLRRSASSGSTLARRGAEFEAKLRAAGVGADGRGVVFITHSMGGLLAKQILRSEIETEAAGASVNGEHCSIVDRTLGVVFIATPHFGAWLPKQSSTRTLFSWLLTPSIELDEMERGSEPLDKLNQSMRKIHDERGVAVLSFGETLPTPLPPSQPNSPVSLVLVPPTSSAPGFGAFELLHEDHLNACKLLNRQSPQYERILQFLRDAERRRHQWQ